MLIGGLWHGAAWSYMFWGGAHGLLLALERLSSGWVTKIPWWKNRFMGMIRIIFTFHVVSLLWLLFVMPNFSKVIEYGSALLTGGGGIGSAQHLFVVICYASPVIVYHLYAYCKEIGIIPNDLKWKKSFIESMVLSIMLFLIVVNSGSTGTFIYFQF